MEFIKQLFNNVPETVTLNNPRQGTQSGDTESVPPTPKSVLKACYIAVRYSTFANRPKGYEFWMPLRGRNHTNLFKSIKLYLFDLFLFVGFLAVGDRKSPVFANLGIIFSSQIIFIDS